MEKVKERWFVAMAVVGCLLMFSAGSAMASGFQLTEKGVKGLGNAYAGGAASADDGSTIYWNPAGMAVLEKSEVNLGLFMVRPYFKFEDKGTTNSLGQPIPGGNGGDAGGYKWVPNLFWSQKLGSKWNVGLGVVAPFGLGTEYDDNWVGRYHSVKSQLTTIDINPSVSYRINNMFSVGGGISAQYAMAELTQAVDYGLATNLSPALGAVFGAQTPSALANDGKAELEGNSWGYGWNLGVMFELSQMTRFGLSYRSQVKHKIEGDVKYSDPSNPALTGISAAANGATKVDAEADIKLPAAASLSGFHRFGNWGIMGDVTWTQWSSLDELRIKFANNNPDNVTTFDWKDTWAFSFGANYYASQAWTVRGGLRYDISPIRNEELRSPRVPDEDRLWAALGATWQFHQSWSLDFAGTYIWVVNTPKIDKTTDLTDPSNENNLRGALQGEYDAYSYILGLQINFMY